MKFTVGTELMKDVVARAIKGAGNNKLLPITSMMCVELSDNMLTTITTDGTNYLYINEEHVAGDDFYVVVDATQFAKLIGKMTSENISMSVKDNLLTVKGNGTYRIELPLDENGATIKYPDPLMTMDKNGSIIESCGTINRSTIQVVLDTVKPALAVTLENPCYTAYYAADKIVATDTYKIASMDVKFFDKPVLISANFLDLVSVMKNEKIDVGIEGNNLVYSSGDCVIYGKFAEGVEDFAIEPISNLIDQEFDSFCAVPKNELLQMLDRLSLFVGTYDKNEVDLTFTENGLQVSSKATSGVEIISYVKSEEFKPFTCSIDIQMLTQEVKAIQSDLIEMFYGNDQSIKMVDGNITIVVALAYDDEDEE